MKSVARSAGERLLREVPLLLVLGPRQCGKSTLVRALRPTWRSLDLERAADLALVAAVPPRSLAGLRQCMSDLGLKRGFVIHTGDERRSVGSSIELVPWGEVREGKIDLPL